MIFGGGFKIIDSSGQIKVSTTAAGSNHNLLDGSVDQDTLAGAVARGDLIIGNSTPKWARLAIGANHTVVKSNGTDPSWGQVDLTTDVTGVLPVAGGGTGTSTGVPTLSSCKAEKIADGDQAISGTGVIITFDTEDWDTDTYHDTTSNKGRFTVPTTAYYRFEWSLLINASASGGMQLVLYKGGVLTSLAEWYLDVVSTGVDFSYSGSAILKLTAADFVNLAYQTLSGTLTHRAGSASHSYTWAALTRIGS